MNFEQKEREKLEEKKKTRKFEKERAQRDENLTQGKRKQIEREKKWRNKAMQVLIAIKRRKKLNFSLSLISKGSGWGHVTYSCE